MSSGVPRLSVSISPRFLSSEAWAMSSRRESVADFPALPD
jgi:hypothetical protein